MTQPKVSIIVPCWGVEKYLDRCVESLVNQTLRDIEIILVDDESPDRVPEICDEWADRDCRIKVVHKKNGGLGFARNSGLEVASGEYVTFCDSDDWVEIETYEVTYNKIKEKDLDICWFQPCRVKMDGTKIFLPEVKEEYFIGKAAVHEFHKDVIGRNVMNPQSKSRNMSSCMALYRRRIFDDCGVRFPSERIVASEDLVFQINFMPYVNSVGILPNVFYNYMINPASISTNYSQVKHERLIRMLTEVKEYCKHNFEWDEIKNHYYSQLLRIFKVILRFTAYSNLPLMQKIGLLTKETKNAMLTDFYADEVCRKYGKADNLYIWMMKHHVGIFFFLLYKLKR